MARGLAVRLALGLSALTAAPLVESAARAQSADIVQPRSLGMGESLRAAAVGSLSTTLNPAGLLLSRAYVLEGTFGYRPQDHANVETVSICDSATNRIAACLYYNHLGASPDSAAGSGDRSLHEAGLTVAAPLSEGIVLGLSNKYVSYNENLTETPPADHSKNGFLLDAGVTIKAVPNINLAFVTYNLLGSDSGQYALAFGGGIAINVSPTLLFAADMRYDTELSKGRYGGGGEYLFSGSDGQQGVPIRVGYVYDSQGEAQFVTGGLGYLTPRISIDGAVRKQVAGPNGDELMLQFSLRLFLPN